ncbi:hypothetical protein [Bradyrhizobium genosp. P]|uniref:hypothetical protein n=1 Tax=Bradyrhizobium genosp. P TaxID=83641 RepID=UPI003CF02CEA
MFDLAILDINVNGESIQPVAEMVASRGFPFFFRSGYGVAGVPEQFQDVPVLTKPVLKQMIDRIWNDEPPGRTRY